MTKLTFLFASFTLALAACTSNPDNSGIDQNKKLNALTADERMNFCTWSVTEEGGEGKKTQCGPNSSTSVQPVTSCTADLSKLPATCAVTVGQAEACIKAVAKDPCNGPESAACAPLYSGATTN
jgi:hypothetical protein